jgi:hypothetical protein
VEGEKAVVVPEVLRKWMPGGMEKITCARA